MMLKKIYLLILVSCCSIAIFAQVEFELNQKYAFKDYCFDSKIKSVLAYKTGSELSEPFILLGGNESITFTFDDLSETSRDLFYTITHCNADWQEDNLFSGDYMKGFAENSFFDYKTSANTNIVYRNYELLIPNRDVQIVTSGNFLLKVYGRNDSSKPLFQKGFRVYERRASADVRYKSLMNTLDNEKQQLEFWVNSAGLQLQNAANEIKVRVEQNSQRMPNAALPIISFQNATKIDYTNATKNIYNAENEYRVFDTRSLAYNAKGVSNIVKQNGEWHVLLNIDKKSGNVYEYNRDINGKYYVEVDRIDKNADKNLEADYVNVYFTIEDENLPQNLQIYVFGALSDWGLKPELHMEYNSERRAYEATALLKQGYYNYKYIAVDARGNFYSDFFDKSFAQTENEYHVFVYHRAMQDRWDKLVAVVAVNTTK